MELITDLMGRPRYGKVDPTLFIFFTYPLFFGLMLGDMAYGAATMLIALLLYRSIGHTENGFQKAWDGTDPVITLFRVPQNLSTPGRNFGVGLNSTLLE